MTTGDKKAEVPSFARTAGRDIFGPLDDSLPEVRINGDVKLDALRAAHALGLDLTAYLRENLYASLYSPEHLGKLYEQRAERVLGNARQATTVGLRVVETPPKGCGMSTRRPRGFAALKQYDPERAREISSLGGRASHALKRGHQFTSEEASAAARKRRGTVNHGVGIQGVE